MARICTIQRGCELSLAVYRGFPVLRQAQVDIPESRHGGQGERPQMWRNTGEIDGIDGDPDTGRHQDRPGKLRLDFESRRPPEHGPVEGDLTQHLPQGGVRDFVPPLGDEGGPLCDVVHQGPVAEEDSVDGDGHDEGDADPCGDREGRRRRQQPVEHAVQGNERWSSEESAPEGHGGASEEIQ